LAITTDGGTLVTASDDHTVRLWRIADARSIRTLMGHEQGLLAVAISPDDSKIAAGAADGEVLLWNATDGALAASTVGHSGEVRGIGFAAGGERIWTASQDGSVRVWSADDLSPLATPMENNEPFVALAVSPDGARVVTSDLYGGLRVWRALEATSERRLEDYGGSHLEFDPTGTLLYSEGTSSVTIVPIDGSQISFLTSPIGDGTLTAAVSPRGDAVFAASGWLTVLFHPGGNQLREPIQQGPIALDAAFSPDGTRLAIGGGFGVAVRSLDTGNVLAAPDHSQSSWHVGGVAFSPDGSKLATGDGSGRLRLWSTTSWQVESAIEEVLDGAATQSIDEVRFSPDGTLLLGTGNVDHDTVYRVTPLEQITSLGLTGACNAGAFSPDGSMVAAANSVGDIVVRRTSDFGEVLRARFPSGGVQSVAFTSDGRFLVSTGYFHVTAWDLVNGAPPNDLLASNDYFGGAVAVSPDGGLLVAGGDDGRLLRWSLPDFTPLPDLPSHRQAVVSARFSSDGRRLAVGHRDGTVWLWCH
jgi:WD40 repeat protein